MIFGAHAILYSKDPDADRAFLRDVLGLPHVDAGDGWLIFGLPPAEVGIHPADQNGRHELYLMCEDATEFVAAMRKRGIDCAPIEDQGYGLMTSVPLPGGGTLGVYEPRHARPESMRVPKGRGAKAKGKSATSAAKQKPGAKPSRQTTTSRKKPTKKAQPARGAATRNTGKKKATKKAKPARR